jgi:multiple sugar transport system substrate-binding protein
VEQWRDLEAGVDSKAPLSDFYGDDVVDRLEQGISSFQRWGIGEAEGGGETVATLYETLVVPQTLNEVLQGGLDPQAAAEQIASEVE